MKSKLLRWGLILAGLILFLALVIRFTTFHPADVQQEAIFGAENAPLMQPGDTIKVMSFNVQYMASKNYVFWYDMPDESGPDNKPSKTHVLETIEAVARVIRAEAPDVILLQEMHEDAVRTYHIDQLAALLALLPAEYRCHSSAFYWKADFVPHPKILGSVGMKLSTISRYKLDQSTRYQLPLFPKDIISAQFYLKRAILETRFPLTDGSNFYALNTHLDAFAHGQDLMQKQVEMVDDVVSKLESAGHTWVIGGDFNILPPDQDPATMPKYLRAYHRPKTELSLLYDKYPAVPAKSDYQGAEYSKWHTHLANHPRVTEPDKIIDYFFYSPGLPLHDSYVRQHDTQDISDHLPIIATFILPEN